ncbi:MAG TPA: hypothetical protein VLW44_16950 [Streptosporangiaceae bacterium]|nr:hypothetical protein [Streptosporangiaceae bacterium]
MKIVTADQRAGARPRVRVSGPVRRVRASGRDGLPMLRAELGGGANRITVVWLGRNRIAGIEPGRVLAVEGMLSEQGGRRIIYNPRYDLGEGPVAGPAPRP